MEHGEDSTGHSSPNQALEPTPYSVRCAPAFRRGSPRAFGNLHTQSEKSRFIMLKSTVVVLFAVALLGCATSTKMNNVSVGMTKQQVIAAMGQPESVRADGGVESLHYKLSESGDWVRGTWGVPTRDYFVRLRNGVVDAYGKVGDFDSTKAPTLNINVKEK